MLGNVLTFWEVVRQLDLASVRRAIERPVRVLVLARAAEPRELIAGALFRPSGPEAELVLADPTAGEDVWRDAWDLAVLFFPGAGADQRAERAALAALTASGTPVVVAWARERGRPGGLDHPPEHTVVLDLADPGAAGARLAPVVVAAANQRAPALARSFPALREATSAALIAETSRVNGQFALLSSLPATIPLVGGLAGDLADLIVLTKNQALLLYQLAGVYGRDLALSTRLFAEVLPVVGAAFFWRTLARSLVGLLPGPIAAVPKVGVAYVGTFVVGRLAHYYYATGRRPPKEAVARFQAQALAQLQTFLGRPASRQWPTGELPPGPPDRPDRPAR